MKFNDQNRNCHAERSEASLCPSRETLRFAQGDKSFPILLGKVHNRGATRLAGPAIVFAVAAAPTTAAQGI